MVKDKVKEKKLTCSGIIKLVLKDVDWLSLNDLKSKSDKIYNINAPSSKEDIRLDTFTKSINNLLKDKEILIKRKIITKNEDEYVPKNDQITYYFKLNSNPSTKLAPELDPNKLLKLLKEFDTTYLIRLNDIRNIENHFKENLLFEIESYKLDYKEYTNFILDVYKYTYPKKAYDSYIEFNNFNNNTSYKDITTKFKEYIEYPVCKYNISKEIININYNFKCYVVEIDNSIYINKKINCKHIKIILLINNLVVVLYFSCAYYYNVADAIYSGKIIAVIQNYIKFLEDKREI